MNNIPKKYQDLLDKFPFLTLIKYGGNEYVGIIQNMDNNLASMYNFENIKDVSDKKEFLEIGEEWWWGTNRMIPINIIFKTKFFCSICRFIQCNMSSYLWIYSTCL